MRTANRVVSSVILGVLSLAVLSPIQAWAGFPTVKELEQSPDRSYVLSLLTPYFGSSEECAVYVAPVVRGKKQKGIRIPIRTVELGSDWQSPCPGDDAMYQQLRLERIDPLYSVNPFREVSTTPLPPMAGVMFAQLKPGLYELAEYHLRGAQVVLTGGSRLRLSEYVTTVSLKVPMRKEFEVPAGKVVYVGSFECREPSPEEAKASLKERTGFAPPDKPDQLASLTAHLVRGRFIDNLPAVLSILDTVEFGLRGVVDGRVVRAEHLRSVPILKESHERRAYADAIQLFAALRRGDVGAAEAILNKGADPNMRYPTAVDWTLLHEAAKGGHEATIRLLLSRGADVNAKTDYGSTPLHFAASEGSKDACSLLIAAGADVNAKAEHGDTPLHSAAFEGSKDACSLLIAAGADVNAKTDHGRTPLHEAAMYGHKDACAVLIAAGADVNAKDGEGRTSLSYAEEELNEKNSSKRLCTREQARAIAELLRKHGGKE